MKKTVFLFAILFLCLFALFSCQNEEPPAETPRQESPVADFEYAVNEDGGITIVKYIGDDANVVIPAKIDGKPVTVINSFAFAFNEFVTSVVFPEGLETIGFQAFYNTKLTEVALPSTLKVLETGAFSCCYQITRATLNDGLIEIGTGSFFGAKITELTIPASVTKIREDAFEGCSNLKKIIFEGNAPENYVNEYSSYSGDGYVIFYSPDAEGFTSPTWNGYLTQKIGEESEMKYENGFGYADTADAGITILDYIGTDVDVVIPDTIAGKPVTGIGMYAFAANEALLSVTMPDTVKEIEPRAFYRCWYLDTVTLSKNLESIGERAFSNSPVSFITLPDTLTTLGTYAFQGCEMNQIKIPKSVVNWGEHVFFGAKLTIVELEEGLECIGVGAFASTKLRSITLPSSMRVISERAFYDCTLLSSVTLNEGLVTIEDEAFRNLTSLNEIIIPSTVENITELAFRRCINLEAVRFAGNAPENYGTDNRDYNVSYTVYFRDGAEGFTRWAWNGYPTALWVEE